MKASRVSGGDKCQGSNFFRHASPRELLYARFSRLFRGINSHVPVLLPRAADRTLRQLAVRTDNTTMSSKSRAGLSDFTGDRRLILGGHFENIIQR